jgi:hypothetical protein
MRRKSDLLDAPTEEGFTAYIFNSELGEGYDYFITDAKDEQIDSGHRTSHLAIKRQLRLVVNIYRENH